MWKSASLVHIHTRTAAAVPLVFVLVLYFLASAASAFSTVIPDMYVSPVSGVLDNELSVSAWYQETRRALLRAWCLLLLLLLAADSRESGGVRCAV